MEIKFRKKDLVKTMRRIDTVYAKLVEQLGKEREFWVVDISNVKFNVKLKHFGGNHQESFGVLGKFFICFLLVELRGCGGTLEHLYLLGPQSMG